MKRQQVITAYEVSERWAVEVDPPARIPYTIETLKKRARENYEGSANWWLIYVIGLSLAEQCRIRGAGSTGGLGRGGGFKCGLPNVSEEYLEHPLPAGYYLFDLRSQFRNRNWGDQNTNIAKLGAQVKRVDERMLSEVLLSCFMVKYVLYGPVQRSYCHWGFAFDAKGGRVTIWQEDGSIAFASAPPDQREHPVSIGAVVMCEPDF